MKKTICSVLAVMIALCAVFSPLPADILSVSAVEEALLGDCDGDGECTISDATMLQNFLFGGYLFYKNNADMNADGTVDAFDLALLKRKLLANHAKYTLEYSIINDEVHITGMTKTTEGDILNVVIPKKIEGLPVTHIASMAFYQTDITSVDIPDTVVSLGDYSFSGCEALKTVYLSANLANDLSGGYLFFNSLGIETVHVPEDMADPAFLDHFNYHTDTVIEGVYSDTLYDLTYRITIADGTASIVGYQSSNMPDISVTIPEEIYGRTVTTIGSRAFRYADICEVILPDTVTTLENWSFFSCDNLTKIRLSKNLIYDPEEKYPFSFCDQLTDVVVPEDMVNPEFLETMFGTPWGVEYFSARIDEKVDAVYNALKAANPDIDWNIADAEGQARENAKYEAAKYIHSQLAGNLIVYDAETTHHTSSYSLVKGRGACAGMARSYILLLLRAGFTPEEVQLVSAPQHALAGIQLYGQWYFVECTDNMTKSFGMTYQNEWYHGTAEGKYNGYYDASDPYIYYFHSHEYCNDDEASEAYLAEKYRSNYNRGDLNMDGATNSSDYAALEAYLGGTAADFNLLNADVNYDRDINETDLAVLNSIITGETDLLSIIIPLYGEPVC